MLSLTKFKIFVFMSITIVKDILCLCEVYSDVVMCDNLNDIKSQKDTSRWRRLLIQSSSYQDSSLNHNLDDDTFSDLQLIKSLTIIKQINGFSAVGIDDLHHLTLYDNEIDHIEDFAFIRSTHLHEVYLERNKIKTLGKQIFGNSTIIDIVSFAHNKIQNVWRNTFYDGNIKCISVTDNRLSYIEPRAFPNGLQALDLSHNELVYLPEDAFANLNNLQCLNISHNNLVSLPVFRTLKQLKNFDISFNQIRVVNYDFLAVQRSVIFNLASNLIEEVVLNGSNPNNFRADKTIILVDLSFNRLTNLGSFPGIFIVSPYYGHPWSCACLVKYEKDLEPGWFDQKNCFKTGEVPICIQNGECGKPIAKIDINNYANLVGKCKNEVNPLKCLINC